MGDPFRVRTMARVVAVSMAAAIMFAWAGLAQAHELNPAIMDIETGDGTVSIELRLPLEALMAGLDLDGLEDTENAADPQAYDSLRALESGPLRARFDAFEADLLDGLRLLADGDPVPLSVSDVDIPPAGNTDIARQSTITLEGQLPDESGTLALDWADGFGLLIVRQMLPDDAEIEPFTQTISGGEVTDAFAIGGGTTLTGWEAFVDYISVGFEHIIPLGFDHILFVLGLFFLAQRLHPLLWQISAFTLAHTITLGLAAAGYADGLDAWMTRSLGVGLIGVVEPLIALSIVYVAVENIVLRELSPWRPALVFGFGLLHGVGFASVLSEFGLPAGQFLPALIGFNIGVEFGQITVILVALAVSWAALRASEEDGMEIDRVYLYITFGLLCAALLILGPGAMPATVATFVYPFLLPLMGLTLLCAVCVAAASVGTAAYRQFVAIPASAMIALVGAYWFVERVFF